MLALACAACKANGTFTCEQDNQCNNLPGGRCESTGYCSFTDPNCSSGLRYDPFAGAGLANECVDGMTPDARPVGDGTLMLVVAHVPPAATAMFDATASVTLGDTTLDTGSAAGGTVPMLSVTLPSGASLTTTPQDGGGPELALLEVGDLTIDGTFTVTGGRPLVIIARTTITVGATGAIEGSAVGSVPGAGGYGPGLGSGAGGAGADDPTSYDDSGGGGGGYGGAGAAGQASGPAVAGLAGIAYGTAALDTLDGGSGGGDLSPTCAGTAAGAGGGAIQLYAGEQIAIAGAVRANGGGGAGGIDCVDLYTSGAGGGAGGAIYLQTQIVTGAGVLLAQGGGGGGGSDINTAMSGTNGSDGPITIAAAMGGFGPGTGPSDENNTGGAGGFRDAGPPALTALSGANYGNGGGGGGGVGRIVVRAGTPGSLLASPTATSVPP